MLSYRVQGGLSATLEILLAAGEWYSTFLFATTPGNYSPHWRLPHCILERSLLHEPAVPLLSLLLQTLNRSLVQYATDHSPHAFCTTMLAYG